MSFFKTNDPEVMAAWNKESAAHSELRKAADEFAARYGGTGHLYSSPVRFAGVKFTPPKPRDLWRAPDNHGLQCPRTRPLTGASASTREELKALNADWMAHVPEERVDSNELYRTLGVSWGDFFFSGLEMFQHGGWLYAKTGTHMKRMTEIMGSEYSVASEARRAAGTSGEGTPA